VDVKEKYKYLETQYLMWTFKMDGDLKKSVQILIYKIATRLFKCLINLPFIHIFKSSEGVSISFETLVVIYQLY